MIRRPPRSTLSSSSAASDVYKRQIPEFGFGNSVLVNIPQLFPLSGEKACTMALFLLLHKICSLLPGWINIVGWITLNCVAESTGITFQVFPESIDFSICTFQLWLVSTLDGERMDPSG